MNKPTVSIITVTYNSAKTLRETLTSVATQKYPYIEHIIVDGLSSDDTVSIAKEFPHIKTIISEKDSGMYDALNKGIAACNGDYIGILNSDDCYTTDDVITTIVNNLVTHNVDAIIADIKFVSATDPEKTIRYCSSAFWDIGYFVKGYMPNHPSYYARREVYENHGSYRLDYNISADYELMVRHMLIGKITYKYIPECLVAMKPGGLSNGSIKKRLILNNEIIKACKDNGVYTNWFKISTKFFRKISEYINTRN